MNGWLKEEINKPLKSAAGEVTATNTKMQWLFSQATSRLKVAV